MNPAIGFARGLPGHPAALQDLSFAYAWLEAPLKAYLAYLTDVPDWQDLSMWPAGRVFGECGEYRWQWESSNKALHAVLLLDNGVLPPEFTKNRAGLQCENDAALILWGEWVDKKDSEGNPDGGPIFYANEIPGMQSYPIELSGAPPDGYTPRLVIRRYRHYRAVEEEEEKGEFMRCVRLAMQGREEED